MKNKTIGLLTAAVITTITLLSSCGQSSNPSWIGKPNPLDPPGHTEATAAELHKKNIKLIRGFHSSY